MRASARTREIGRMLSGERLTDAALRHAAQLLKAAGGAARSTAEAGE
jgi:DNA repair ATPase RecN